MICSDYSHRWLILSLTRRRVAERYRGSLLGLAWAVIMPFLMLAVYTLFFRHFLGVKWPGAAVGSDIEIAVQIFVGLMIVNYASEILVGSPRLILEQPAYVTKIQFPLEILAYVQNIVALIQAGISMAVVLVILLPSGLGGGGSLLLPVYFLLIFIWGLAASWILSAIGVFLRDLQQVMPPFVTVLLFLSPVFYPVNTLREPWNFWVALNPLSQVIEGIRYAVANGPKPAFDLLAIHFLFAFAVLIVARWVFTRLKVGFSDAI